MSVHSVCFSLIASLFGGSLMLVEGQTTPSTATLKGNYVMTESGHFTNGQEFSALGVLNFDGNGRVTGKETMKGSAATLELTLAGTYELNADGLGSISVSYPVTTATDDTDSAMGTTTYRLIYSAQHGIRAIRNDLGIVSNVELEAASAISETPNVSGSYLFVEDGVDSANQPFTSISTLTFSAAGRVTGTVIVKGFAASLTYGVEGTYQVDSTGSGTLTLNAVSVDESGETRTQVSSYRTALAANSELRALRVDAGVVSETEVLRR